MTIVSESTKCPSCDGTGLVHHITEDALGYCPTCAGSGRWPQGPVGSLQITAGGGREWVNVMDLEGAPVGAVFDVFLRRRLPD